MNVVITDELNTVFDKLRRQDLNCALANLSTGTDLPVKEYEESTINYYKFETHKYCEIAIQISGTSIINCNDKYYPLKKHQIFLLDRNVTHRLCYETRQKEPMIMLWTAVTAATLRPGLSTYFENNTREKHWALDIFAPGGYLLSNTFDELQLEYDNKNQAIASYLASFIMLLNRKITFVGEVWDSSRKTAMVNEVQRYIIQNISKPISLNQLSSLVSVSASYLCRIFKQITGTTIYSYIQDTRIRFATEYLVSSEMTLAEISEKLGFYDQFHFSKTFKAYTGISPTEYKANQAQNQ